MLGINHQTAILFYHKVRGVIAIELAKQEYFQFGGEIELDESYFGSTRKGKRGRGAARKVAVFGIEPDDIQNARIVKTQMKRAFTQDNPQTITKTRFSDDTLNYNAMCGWLNALIMAWVMGSWG